MNNHILMESYFNPNLAPQPLVHIGSQSNPFFYGKPREQAWEGWHLVGTNSRDLIVLRDFDPVYLDYWTSLIGSLEIINLLNYRSKGKCLSEVILRDQNRINLIKAKMARDSKLAVFLPTELEQKLADVLGIPLHGSPPITKTYGTKSGIRKLAKEANISMPPGFICTTYSQVKDAIANLRTRFKDVVIKHDLSVSGYFTKRWKTHGSIFPRQTLDQFIGRKFVEGKDTVVVEGWLKTKQSLCAHIEILHGQAPIICGAWQQIIDSDRVSFIGAEPLNISTKAMKSLTRGLRQLATALKAKGAVGSYGPDFVVVDDDETNTEPDSCVLIELNARLPYTALPLKTIKTLKGKINNGFLIQHISLAVKTSFQEIKEVLQNKGLLITAKDCSIKGVIPFNIGLLPWGLFDVLIIADYYEECNSILQVVKDTFKKR